MLMGEAAWVCMHVHACVLVCALVRVMYLTPQLSLTSVSASKHSHGNQTNLTPSGAKGCVYNSVSTTKTGQTHTHTHTSAGILSILVSEPLGWLGQPTVTVSCWLSWFGGPCLQSKSSLSTSISAL